MSCTPNAEIFYGGDLRDDIMLARMGLAPAESSIARRCKITHSHWLGWSLPHFSAARDSRDRPDVFPKHFPASIEQATATASTSPPAASEPIFNMYTPARATARLCQVLRHQQRHRFYSTETSFTGDHVRIVEVGPRDGLQNEKKSIPMNTKLELIHRLAKTGVTTIEAGSFVPEKWVPQMASTGDILSHLLKSPPKSSHPIAYNYLVPNVKGLQNLVKIMDAESASPESSTSNTSSKTTTEVSIFAAATDAFSKANTNCTVDESLERFRPVVSLAKEKNIRVRGYVSVALGCPYEGPDVSPHKVAEITATLLEMGADEVSVADTTGMGTAPRTLKLLQTLSSAGIANNDLALHFHDTYGQALVNTIVGLEHGIRIFDSSVGGLGGCPYSKGATGNISTEDLIHTVHSLGMRTGINLEEMARIGDWISSGLGRSNDSRVGKATLARLQG
ncbi:hypothetical protein AJ79_04029 [Helicocarpus griseus UAMH5409]|uniref:hydroxymethylglutaryl-CoA lyase n=1 Tax=Helicocarpus griseus UAMH5409 TaxID=1447875 RepID=A0A2B7XV32_9EURO|nr:hypothetical protein AJ79_04029 [Helicocarpus griseus UAMH5409]